MNLSIKDAKQALTKTDLLVVLGLERKALSLPAGVNVPALSTRST